MNYLSRPGPEERFAKVVPGEPLIVFKDVRIGFDEGEILRGVSFEVMPGETKVLLGESGSGKTLIMKMAAGLLRPDDGRIWVMGHELSQMGEQELLYFRRHVGFVFQEGALFDSLTVAENVAFRLREEDVAEGRSATGCARPCASWSWKRRWSDTPLSFPEGCAGASPSPALWSTGRRSYSTIHPLPDLTR